MLFTLARRSEPDRCLLPYLSPLILFISQLRYLEPTESLTGRPINILPVRTRADVAPGIIETRCTVKSGFRWEVVPTTTHPLTRFCAPLIKRVWGRAHSIQPTPCLYMHYGFLDFIVDCRLFIGQVKSPTLTYINLHKPTRFYRFWKNRGWSFRVEISVMVLHVWCVLIGQINSPTVVNAPKTFSAVNAPKKLIFTIFR